MYLVFLFILLPFAYTESSDMFVFNNIYNVYFVILFIIRPKDSNFDSERLRSENENYSNIYLFI